jgi:transposase InsO family protein
VVRWQKERFKKYWAAKSRLGKRSGRPAVSQHVRELIRRMATENDWGAPRIHAELLKLGLDVSQATVSRCLPKRPAPDKVERWKKFLRNHLPHIAAMDFFTIPTASFKLLHGFFVIHHDRRRILHINVTAHPTAQWVIQQLREAFPFTPSAKHLIHDRDSKFSAAVKGRLKALGIESAQTAFRAPFQNAIAERLVLSIRTELLDHVVVLNEAHARRLLAEYVAYHRQDRCHLALDKDCPESRPVQPHPPGDAEVIAFPRVGGIHHRYEWKQAA